MARHDLYTNDPSIITNKQLHIPCYLTTSDVLSAITTMVQGDFALSTDNNMVYFYNNGTWNYFGGGTGVSANTVAAYSVSLSSLVSLNLQGGQIFAIV